MSDAAGAAPAWVGLRLAPAGLPACLPAHVPACLPAAPSPCAGEERDQTPISAAVAMCNPFNLVRARKTVPRGGMWHAPCHAGFSLPCAASPPAPPPAAAQGGAPSLRTDSALVRTLPSCPAGTAAHVRHQLPERVQPHLRLEPGTQVCWVNPVWPGAAPLPALLLRLRLQLRGPVAQLPRLTPALPPTRSPALCSLNKIYSQHHSKFDEEAAKPGGRRECLSGGPPGPAWLLRWAGRGGPPALSPWRRRLCWPLAAAPAMQAPAPARRCMHSIAPAVRPLLPNQPPARLVQHTKRTGRSRRARSGSSTMPSPASPSDGPRVR